MVSIVFILAVMGLSACGLYFGESSQNNQQPPDAANNSVPDASNDGGIGCGSDGGYHPPDAWPSDGGYWYPDAAYPIDAGGAPDAY